MSLKPILVTTEYRGVFFGYTEEGVKPDMSIDLVKARNCVYWDEVLKGFLGLAAFGPNAKCRIGPAVDITLYKVTLTGDPTPAAVKAWEAAPWSK